MKKFFLFPLTRLVLVLLVLVAAFIARDVVANGLLTLPRDAEAPRALVTALVVCLAYVGFVRLVERRPVRELAPRKALQELGVGVVIGAGLIGLVVGVLAALGYYQVVGVDGRSALAVALVAGVGTAFWEEIAFRGVVFRIVEEGLGTWVGLIVSAVVFGLLHLGNDNASVFGVITTAGVAGVLLGGVYILTRRLWLAIGIHYAVNLTQGPVFGLPVSGEVEPGLLEARLEGPAALTGGAYGIEASVVTAVLGSAAAIYVVRRAYVEGRFVVALWSRRQDVEHGGVISELR